MDIKQLLKTIFLMIISTTAIQAGVVIIDYNSGTILQPYSASCTTSTYPNTILQGGSTTVSINYNNLPYSPNAINVDCGNGFTATAFNCNGQTGQCQATCNYNTAGTFYPKAGASGISCQSAQLHATILTPILQLTPIQLTYPILIAKPIISGEIVGSTRCVDGTPNGICSQNYNGYLCQNGNLRESASKCGCPTNFAKDSNSEACVPLKCSDGTIAGQCSSNQPLYCNSNAGSPALIEKASLCGCRNGFERSFDGDSCIAKISRCSDGTAYGQCSPTKPLYCNNGILEENANSCGCPAGQYNSNGQCTYQFKTCSVIAVPKQQEQTKPVAVTVKYGMFNSNPSTFLINCGDGNTVQAQCNAGNSASFGTCTATCNYAPQQEYPKEFKISASNEIVCEDATISLIAAPKTSGTVLAKITDCKTGEPIQSAAIIGATATSLLIPMYTNKYGEALITNLQPDAYYFAATANGYETTLSSTIVTAASSQPLEACLEKTVQQLQSCDFEAEIAEVPSCTVDENKISKIKLKLKNNLTLNNTLQLTYSSPTIPIYGPDSITLSSSETLIQAINYSYPDGLVGNYPAIINFKGQNGIGCKKSIQLPLCANNKLSITPNEREKSALIGEKTCFAFTLKNFADENANVVLKSEGEIPANFEGGNSIIVPSRGVVEKTACYNIPQLSIGQKQLNITAQSTLNDARTHVLITISGAYNAFSTDYGTACRKVNSGSNKIPITIANQYSEGSYDLQLQSTDSAISASLDSQYVQDFPKGARQTVYLNIIAPTTAEAKQYSTYLKLLKNGAELFSQRICVETNAFYGFKTKLTPKEIELKKCESKAVTLDVENIGASDNFTISNSNSFSTIVLSDEKLEVKQGQIKTAFVYLHPKYPAQVGEYNITIKTSGKLEGKNDILKVKILDGCTLTPINASTQQNVGKETIEKLSQEIIVLLKDSDVANNSTKVKFSIKNSANESKIAELSITGLNESKISYRLSSRFLYLNAREEKEVEITLLSKSNEASSEVGKLAVKVENATLEYPFEFLTKAEKKEESSLTAQFTSLFSQPENAIIIFAIIVILAAASFLFYKASALKTSEATAGEKISEAKKPDNALTAENKPDRPYLEVQERVESRLSEKEKNSSDVK